MKRLRCAGNRSSTWARQVSAAHTPSARQHAEKVAGAAYAVCEAAIAVGGCTPELRMVFGQYIGATALKRRHAESLLSEED